VRERRVAWRMIAADTQNRITLTAILTFARRQLQSTVHPANANSIRRHTVHGFIA
jgi:L-amino acid N-acyltransferase YncA